MAAGQVGNAQQNTVNTARDTYTDGILYNKYPSIKCACSVCEVKALWKYGWWWGRWRKL